MCWWCQPQLRAEAAGAFIKDRMTHLLSPRQYYTLLSFLCHKERGAAVSKGVRSYHFSDTNRGAKEHLLPIVWCEQHKHSDTHAQMEKCLFLRPARVQVVSFSYVSASVPACYLAGGVYQAQPGWRKDDPISREYRGHRRKPCIVIQIQLQQKNWGLHIVLTDSEHRKS